MEIIKIGEPIITQTGAIVSRYIENGRLFKSIDFMNSSNKIARQKGLVKTVVRYGEKNRPESVFDTFERKIERTVKETAKKIESKNSIFKQ